MSEAVEARLEYLRGELRAERISYGELFELQSLADHIPAGDLELREAAGLPEFEDDVDGGCTGYLDRATGTIQHDDDTCPIHEGGAS